MIDTSQNELLVTNDDDRSRSPHSDRDNIIYIHLIDIIKTKTKQKNDKTIN